MLLHKTDRAQGSLHRVAEVARTVWRRPTGRRATRGTMVMGGNKERAISAGRLPASAPRRRSSATADRTCPAASFAFSSIAVAPRESDNGIVVAWRPYTHPERGEVIVQREFCIDLEDAS